MNIFRPTKTDTLTQKFGEAKPCVKTDLSGRAVRPFRIVGKNVVNVCPNGSKDFYKEVLGMKGHNGEDWKIYHGEPVYFSIDAKTAWTAWTEVDVDGGLGIDIISDSPIELKDGSSHRVKFRFWHLKEFLIYDGQKVFLGQKIARGDSTGASGGDHLHWSMKFVDENDIRMFLGNGYYGAVDMHEYGDFENVFVIDKLKIYQNQITALLDKYLQLLKYLVESLQKKTLALIHETPTIA